MNYGYSCSHWTEEEMQELAKELDVLCKKNPDAYKMHPYVEINGLYDGVRIRRITHLMDNEDCQFQKKADEIYLKLAKKFGKDAE
jgi:hypothetical protein